MLNADGSAVTGSDTYGYAESGKASGRQSGSKKKLSLLILPLICLVCLIICGIVAIALIPVYLGGGNSGGGQSSISIPEAGSLMPSGRMVTLDDGSTLNTVMFEASVT